MERREFIRYSSSFCALIGVGAFAVSFSSCSKMPVYKAVVNDNKIKVPLNLFVQSEIQIIRPKQSEYDIALRKEPDGTYTALLLRCTHRDTQLTSTGNGFVCSLHGSIFDKEGTVTKGPAEHHMKRYHTEVNADEITIFIK